MEMEIAFCNVNSNYVWKTSLTENSPVQKVILIIFFETSSIAIERDVYRRAKKFSIV
jgi:hypothetical protein